MTKEQARIGTRVTVQRALHNEWNGFTGRIVDEPPLRPDIEVVVKFDSVPLGWGPGNYRAPLNSLVFAETPRERNKRLLSKQRNNL